MGSTGSCVVTLKIAKSKSYPAKTSMKTITLVTSTTTATVAPMTSTTVKPTTTAAPSASAATVRTDGYAFTPTSIKISVGQSVTFAVSSSHDVTWRNGDTGRGATGATYSRTFSTTGSFSFFCSIHEEMTGTITVG
jgi:plastocyanin